MDNVQTQEYIIAAVSSNTNSFGLHQLLLVGRDGSVYKSHASKYNLKPVGEKVNRHFVVINGVEMNRGFVGHELTTKLPPCPQDLVDEIWKGE